MIFSVGQTIDWGHMLDNLHVELRPNGGVISVLSIAVNVFIFAYILKRARAQKKNPWKEEIFTDTRDYIEAMDRA